MGDGCDALDTLFLRKQEVLRLRLGLALWQYEQCFTHLSHRPLVYSLEPWVAQGNILDFVCNRVLSLPGVCYIIAWLPVERIHRQLGLLQEGVLQKESGITGVKVEAPGLSLHPKYRAEIHPPWPGYSFVGVGTPQTEKSIDIQATKPCNKIMVDIQSMPTFCPSPCCKCWCICSGKSECSKNTLLMAQEHVPISSFTYSDTLSAW